MISQIAWLAYELNADALVFCAGSNIWFTENTDKLSLTEDGTIRLKSTIKLYQGLPSCTEICISIEDTIWLDTIQQRSKEEVLHLSSLIRNSHQSVCSSSDACQTLSLSQFTSLSWKESNSAKCSVFWCIAELDQLSQGPASITASECKCLARSSTWRARLLCFW